MNKLARLAIAALLALLPPMLPPAAMANSTTTNLGLNEPTVGADADTWGTLLNANSDTLDGMFSGVVTGIPALNLSNTFTKRQDINADTDPIPTVYDSTSQLLRLGCATSVPCRVEVLSAQADPLIGFEQMNGTFAAPTYVHGTQVIGGLSWRGCADTTCNASTGAGFTMSVAQLRGVSCSDWTTTSHCAEIYISTTKDGTTTEAEKWRVQNAGNVRQTLNVDGTLIPAPPTGTTYQIGQADSTANIFLLDGYAGSPSYSGRESAGTGGSPTATGNGTSLVSLDGYSRAASAYTTVPTVSIKLTTDQAQTDTAQGSAISFQTTPNGSTASSKREVFRLGSDGTAKLGAYTGSALGVLYAGTDGTVARGAVGTWTPSITFSTPGDVSVSCSTQTGRYTTLGDLVFAEFSLTCTPTYTTASGTLRVTGLPVSAANTDAEGGSVRGLNNVTYTSGDWITLRFDTASTLALAGQFSGGGALLSTTSAASGTAITISGSITYKR